MKYLQTYNESIKNVLKPKSKEDIIKSINNLPIGVEKIRYIIDYDIIDLIDIDEFKKNFFYLYIEEWVEYLTLPSVRDIFTNGEITSIKNSLTDLYYELYDSDSRNYWIEKLKNTTLFTKDEIKQLENDIQNESIKNVLKPKPKEHLDEISNTLPPNMKILKGCEYGMLWLVIQGIQEGGDPTISKNSPIRLSVDNQHIDIIRYLLTIPEVDPSDDYNAAIWDAVQEENYKIVKILLDDDRILKRTIQDGDIDHFIEVVHNFYKDDEWVKSISDRIDNLSRK